MQVLVKIITILIPFSYLNLFSTFTKDLAEDYNKEKKIPIKKLYPR